MMAQHRKQAQKLSERGYLSAALSQQWLAYFQQHKGQFPGWDFCQLCVHQGLIGEDAARVVRQLVELDSASAVVSQSGGFEHPKYSILRELGQGGMGRVYLARSRSSQALFVIKTLLRDDSKPEARERFRREAELLSRLQHPNVVGVKDFGEQAGQPYLVMDYIEGLTLDQVIRGSLSDSGRIPAVSQVIETFLGLAEALVEMHSLGIIHRDIKPSNILVEKNSGRVVLVDLGLARLDSQGDVDSEDLTKTGQMLGSPGFMAPEQLSATSGGMGLWTDVWGFGATLFFALTGQQPVSGRSFVEMAGALAAGEVRRVRELNTEVPSWLDRLCRECMVTDPKERLTVHAIQKILKTEGREGWPRRLRKLWTAAFAGLLLLALGLMVFNAKDVQPPSLSLDLESDEIKTRERLLVLRGRVLDEQPRGVLINGEMLEVTSKGLFRKRLRLNSGSNQLTVQALDWSGLKSPERTLTVYVDNQAPALSVLSLTVTAENVIEFRGQLSKSQCRVQSGGQDWEVKGREVFRSLPIGQLKALEKSGECVRVTITDAFGNVRRHVLPITVIRPSTQSYLHPAISNAPSGAVIVFQPGQYSFQFELNKSLSFVGVGGREGVVLKALNEPLISARDAEVCVQGVTLIQEGLVEASLNLVGGALTVRDCHLVLSGEHGLQLGRPGVGVPRTRLLLANSAVEVFRPKRLVIHNCDARVENVQFFPYAKADRSDRSYFNDVIYARTASRLSMQRCYLTDLKNGGLNLESTELDLSLCYFKGLAEEAVEHMYGNASVLGCTFVDAAAGAFKLIQFGRTLVFGCRVLSSGMSMADRYSGVYSDMGSESWFQYCEFLKQNGCGVCIRPGSFVTVRDCVFRDNKRGAVSAYSRQGLSLSGAGSESWLQSRTVFEHNSEAIGRLLQVLRKADLASRQSAFDELANSGSRAIPVILKQSVQSDTAEAVRLKAQLLGILRAKPEEAWPWLVEKALVSGDKWVRWAAIWSLVEMGPVEGMELRLRELLKSSSLKLRVAVLRLVQYGRGFGAGILKDIRRHLKLQDKFSRRFAYAALAAQLPDDEALALLTQGLRDSDWYVRKGVIGVLARRSKPESDALLQGALRSSADFEERRFIVREMAHSSQAVLSDLKALLRDPDCEFKADVLETLMVHSEAGVGLVMGALEEELCDQQLESLERLILLIGSMGVRAKALRPRLLQLFEEREELRIKLSCLWALKQLRGLSQVRKAAERLVGERLTGVDKLLVRSWLAEGR